MDPEGSEPYKQDSVSTETVRPPTPPSDPAGPPQSQQYPQPAQQKKKRIPLSSNVKLALLLFGLAGATVVSIIPKLPASSLDSAPPFWIFLVAGLTVICLTGLLFWYLSRLNLGFGKTGLLLAFFLSATIATIKMVLAPLGMYVANQRSPFTEDLFDYNSGTYFFLSGVSVLLLYLLVFWIIYRIIRRHLLSRTPSLNSVPASAHRAHTKRWIAALLIIGAIILTGGGVLVVPLIPGLIAAGYVSIVFSGLIIPIVFAIGLAAFFAYWGLETVSAQAVSVNSAVLLASFFWLGVSLIILYHVFWIVFMFTLTTIWPFRTVSSK